MKRIGVLAAAVGCVIGLGGCGDGIQWSNLNPELVQVSFIGFSPAPGPPPVPVPAVFRDQALEFTFDTPLDDSTLGGFFMQGGAPLEMLGVAAAGLNGVPYYPFADQGRARDSLQIRKNEAGAAVVDSYVVGRHRDRPDTVVVDPKVDASNPFGLPPSLGFEPNTVYVYQIPFDDGFRFQVKGYLLSAAPAGADLSELPILIPPFSTMPELSRLFLVGFSFGPNPTPPEVLSIESMSGAAGTGLDPIPGADGFVVTFSRAVTLASIDIHANFVVRNLDVVNSSSPQGIFVPGSVVPQVPGPTADSVFLFFPVAPYGPGVSPGTGYDIEVRVGAFGQPPSIVPPILSLPSGIPGTQLALSNSLNRTFRTTPCSGCSVTASLIEEFSNSANRDLTFVATFGPTGLGARWNDATLPGELAGRFISGSPSGVLGTRIQYVVSPQPENMSPAGLFSPFDASVANSGGQCLAPPGCNLGAVINPNGGSHIMHIYESPEFFGLQEDSLEQIEWAPVIGVTAQSVYPQYSIWCGVSNISAPISGGVTQGLNTVFDSNYTLLPYQTGIPTGSATNGPCGPPTLPGAKKVPCGLNQTYSVNLSTTTYYPFPLLGPPFDFATSTGGSGVGVNLLFEQNIEPGMQVPNFNRYRATAFQPVRRLINGPLSLVPPSVCPFNHGGTFDVYRTRFTFVGVVSQAKSLWYDTGTPDPDYVDFVPSPPVSQQPFGTSSTWILEGTDVVNPGPGTVGASGVFIDAAGVTHPTVLTSTIAQLRYFRFRVELRANNITNATPAYTSVVMAYSF